MLKFAKSADAMRDAESWETYLHEQARSYPVDLLDIDRGAYRQNCTTCGKSFQGFKRRVTCRVCETDDLRSIVGSQAQKIADLNRVGSNTLLALIMAQEKIAEQAKEIERLKQRIQDDYEDKAGF